MAQTTRKAAARSETGAEPHLAARRRPRGTGETASEAMRVADPQPTRRLGVPALPNNELKFLPIQRFAAAHLAVQQLREMVVNGTLQPSRVLPPERELAVQLGVSRSTLREAIRALELVNVLESKQGSGTFVTSLEPSLLVEPISILFDTNRSSLLELFEAREVLETGIARLSAQRITEDELMTLEHVVEESSGCVDDPLAFLALDLRLHELIATACHNTLLIKMADSVAALARESRNRTTRIDAVRHRALEDHRALAKALRARDPDDAETAMKAHLRTVKAGYLGLLEEPSVVNETRKGSRKRRTGGE